MRHHALRPMAVFAVLLAICAAQAAGAAQPIYGKATVAPFKKAPVIDGKIAPGEWDGAVRTTGFQKLFGGGGGQIVARGGKAVLDRKRAWDKPPFKEKLKVGDLPDGEYKLTVTLDGWKDPFERSFKRIHFSWEGNTLGITDKVLPPFTPGQGVLKLLLEGYGVRIVRLK